MLKFLDLAFSPCPNDTFIFYAMVHNKIDTKGLTFQPHLFDVEELNRKAERKTFHITKLSFFAYFMLKDNYELLDSGSALGYGCGPLLIAKDANIDIAKARIAIPGALTTAHLLLRLWKPEAVNLITTRFDKILQGVQAGDFDAGLIIHEGRFIYRQYDCVEIIDLGRWWEEETGFPIPLGCICISKEKPVYALKKDIDSIIRNSIEYSFNNFNDSKHYIKKHAQEMNDEVIDKHIRAYVNDFTISLGREGKRAIKTLEDMAHWKKILP